MGWYDNASNEEQDRFHRYMEEAEHWNPAIEVGQSEIRKLKKENERLKKEVARLKRKLYGN